MFEAATNREEYYKMLAQKVYHIQKELEDRKNKKKPGAITGTDYRYIASVLNTGTRPIAVRER